MTRAPGFGQQQRRNLWPVASSFRTGQVLKFYKSSVASLGNRSTKLFRFVDPCCFAIYLEPQILLAPAARKIRGSYPLGSLIEVTF